MSDREMQDQITALEAALAKHKQWLKEIADVGCEHAETSVILEEKVVAIAGAMQELALGCLSLTERVKRIEDRLGMEA